MIRFQSSSYKLGQNVQNDPNEAIVHVFFTTRGLHCWGGRDSHNRSQLFQTTVHPSLAKVYNFVDHHIILNSYLKL